MTLVIGWTAAREAMTDQHSLFTSLSARAVDYFEDRAALLAKWFVLMRDVLPDMATECRWPISSDHCFMRVCLDAAIGAPWTTVVKRPAIRHLMSEQLRAAIAVADGIVSAPETLHALNEQSIRWRQEMRQAGNDPVNRADRLRSG